MAMNLTAIFKVRDEGSAKLRKLTQHMERMNKTSDKVSGSITKSQSAVEKLGRTSSSASGGIGKLKTSFGGLATAVVGVASAYLSAQSAANAFNATIGAAAKYEQQAAAMEGMFGDAKQAQKYLKMVDKAAIASPVLSSTDMIENSKSFIGLSKDIGQLEKVWSLVERIQAYSGVDTAQASFSTKELFQGDSISMVQAIGLDKREMQRIAKMDGLDNKVKALDQVLNKMGVGQAMVDKMGNTVLGQWSSMGETVETFFRNVGMDSTSKLSKALKGVSKEVDKIFTNENASKLGAALGTIVEKAVEVGKFLWEWREPLLAVVKTVGAIAAIAGTVLAVAGVVAAIGALTSPIGYIVIGITAAVAGFKMLYDKSETFRNSINGIMEKVKGLYNAFQSGGAGGLLGAMFGEGTTGKVSGIIATIVEKFNQLKSGFEIVKGALVVGWQTVSDIFMSAWGIVSPILSGLWSLLQIVGDIAVIVFNNVIAPALAFIMQLFSTLWTIAQPILQHLAEKFEVLSAVIKWLWDVILKPLVEYLLGNFKKGFENATKVLEGISAAFETVTGWVQKAKDLISDFASAIKKVKVPDWVSKLGGGAVSFVQNLTGDKPKGHYHGLDRVPYDGYNARLHKNEKILTAQEAKAYREGKGGGGITIAKLADQIIVREEADIDKFAYKLAKLIEKEAAMIG